MISVLIGAAWAMDPAVLRGPLAEDTVGIDAGAHGLSVAWSPSDELALALAWGPGAVGPAVGLSRALTGRQRRWGIDASVGLGVLASTVRPGVALLTSGGIAGGLRGSDGLATLGLALPATVGGVPAGLAVPSLLELRLGRRLGETWIGLRGTTGAVFSVSGPPALRAELAAWIRLGLPGEG